MMGIHCDKCLKIIEDPSNYNFIVLCKFCTNKMQEYLNFLIDWADEAISEKGHFDKGSVEKLEEIKEWCNII